MGHMYKTCVIAGMLDKALYRLARLKLQVQSERNAAARATLHFFL